MSTASPDPINTITPTLASIEVVTPTPIPSSVPTTEEWIYPYTIEGLRSHKFQGGTVHIRTTLGQTKSYTRYLIDYPSDGLTITGVMHIPVGEGPFPVIVMNHGYFNRGDFASGDGTDRAAEFLNKRGYLTISPDYRSWGGSDIGSSLFYSGLVTDVINLLDAIPTVPEADAERVGMWGHSMGGGVTIKALTILGGRVVPSDSEEHTLAPGASAGVETTVRAAVLYSTVSADDADILLRWGLGCIGDIGAGELQLGCNSAEIVPLDLPPGLIQAYHDASTNPDILRQTSPFYNLDLVDAPIQIAYGTEDGKVFSGTPPEWSQKLYQGLKDAGKDVQLFAYEGEGHSFIGDNWFAFMERTAKFFDEHVKNAN